VSKPDRNCHIHAGNWSQVYFAASVTGSCPNRTCTVDVGSVAAHIGFFHPLVDVCLQ